MQRSAIFAIDEAGGFGKDGKLPWCFPTEMKWFKEVTTSCPNPAVIMGRRTWTSIPASRRPLPGRINIVVTSRERDDPEFGRADAVAPSLDAAYAQAEEMGAGCAFVIGGKSLLEDAWAAERTANKLTSVFVTMINGVFDCDVTLAPPSHLLPAFDASSNVLHRESLTNRRDGKMYTVGMCRFDVD